MFARKAKISLKRTILNVCVFASLIVTCMHTISLAKPDEKKKKTEHSEKKEPEKKEPAKKTLPQPLIAPQAQSQETYWCGKIQCTEAKEEGDAACLFSLNEMRARCIYGTPESEPTKVDDAETDEKLLANDLVEGRTLVKESSMKINASKSAMENCILFDPTYSLRTICGGFSATFDEEKTLVKGTCTKGDITYICGPAIVVPVP